MDTPSKILQPHESTFVELTKCGETHPCHTENSYASEPNVSC